MVERAPITAEEVARIASLARLDLSPEEVSRMTSEISHILAHVDELAVVDVEAVPPTAHGEVERTQLRADAPRPSLPAELATREAPRTVELAFAVPAFVDEG